MRITGVVPILCTPYDADGKVVPDEVAAEVEWVAREGADGVGVAIASEVFFLDDNEWADVVSAAVAAARDAGIPLVASVGRNDLDATRRRAADATALGASALMAYPSPSGSRETADLVEYYAAVADAGVPVWVQDAPGLAGDEIPLAAYPAIAAVEGVVGFKVEVMPTPVKIAEARKVLPAETVILGGAGGFVFPDELEVGAEGTMPGVTACRTLRAVWDAFGAGGIDAARAAHATAAETWGFSLDNLGAFVHLQKAALVALGIFSTDTTRFGERAEPDVAARFVELVTEGR